MSLPPVPNTEIRSDNIWLSWFREIYDLFRYYFVFSGSNVIVKAQGSNLGITVKSTGQMRMSPLAATPAGLQDGDIWYDASVGKFRGRAAGVVVDLH